MKSLTFAKRNILEHLRSPINLFFTLFFPIIMFFVFKIIVYGTGATVEQVPMFATNNLIPSIAIFSFSFIALTTSIQIAKDRETAFQSRLCVSPMMALDFFVGYLLPAILLAIIQILICFCLGAFFGLSISINLLPCFFALLLISLFYISFGILIGSVFNEKTCGGLSSILVNVTAVFSGMFFPLTSGTFKTILSFLPFLPSVEIPQTIINGSFSNLWQNFAVILIYLVLTAVLSIFAFKRRIKSN